MLLLVIKSHSVPYLNMGLDPVDLLQVNHASTRRVCMCVLWLWLCVYVLCPIMYVCFWCACDCVYGVISQ